MSNSSIVWTAQAQSDLARLLRTRVAVTGSSEVARRTLVVLITEMESLLQDMPRLGTILPQHVEQDVRRLVIGNFESRYTIRESDICILQIFHTLEDI